MGHNGTEALGRPQLRLQAGVANGPVPRLEWIKATRPPLPQLPAAPDAAEIPHLVSHWARSGLSSTPAWLLRSPPIKQQRPQHWVALNN